jgi:hypothetical protein
MWLLVCKVSAEFSQQLGELLPSVKVNIWLVLPYSLYESPCDKSQYLAGRARPWRGEGAEMRWSEVGRMGVCLLSPAEISLGHPTQAAVLVEGN